ncbi:MAG: hypothetical protein RLZZ416_828 [Candidatus Parcubacteria bacterium]|jgi:hypothetical protein
MDQDKRVKSGPPCTFGRNKNGFSRVKNAVNGGKRGDAARAEAADRNRGLEKVTCTEHVAGGPCGASTPDPRVCKCLEHGGDEILERLQHIKPR